MGTIGWSSHVPPYTSSTSNHMLSLQIKLAENESLIEHLRLTVNKLTTELEDNRHNLDKQTAVNKQDKVLMDV